MREQRWIFIGYSSADEERVEEIYRRLFAAGFRPWAYGRDLLPGDELPARLRAAVSSADFFLACLSNNSVGETGAPEPRLSEQLNLHLQATHAKAFLIPVRLEECPVPVGLHDLEVVDLFREGGWTHLLELITTVAGRRKEAEEAWAGLFSEADGDAADAVDTPAATSPEEDDEEEGGADGPADRHSAHSWQADLRRLISGGRGATLERLGGVEEYVEMNLEEADDRDAAKQAFDEALEKLVQTWRPSTLSEEDAPLLLDLIRLYTPPGGFVKVVTFIQRLKLFADAPGGGDAAGGGDVFRNALGVLESYYGAAPPPPEDASAAYKTYLDLLREELLSPANSGYAARRLIELKVLEPKSEEIRRLIETSPLGVGDLVNLLLNLNHHAYAEEGLTTVLTYCVNAGDEAVLEFQRAVARCGGKIKDSGADDRPIHVVYGREERRLRLPTTTLYKYQQLRWRQAEQEGLSRLKEMANI